MSAREKLVYECSACAAQAPKWAGRCSECGEWNTLQEVITQARAISRGHMAGAQATRALDLMDVSSSETHRLSTGLTELDRVLGGGLVPGSVVLIGGDPGIGKSTILLQAMSAMAARDGALYVTGEESLEQVALRARRLGLGEQGLRIMAETCLERLLPGIQQEKLPIVVIDSVQTLYTEALNSAPGGVAQVRECAAGLVRHAKQHGVALFLVGHVTKEGALAGPRVLEHMVDCVLYFEGASHDRFRVLRAVKNRFGAVNELGVFAMSDQGLKEVTNPSRIFLSRDGEPVAGSSVLVTWEGTRPLLVEVQALVDDSPLGNPRRVTVGMDHNRLALLLAVLHRHGGIAIHDQDVFANVVGGVRVSETGVDLPLLLAVVSSLRNRPLPPGLVSFGEVGLSGEIRPVPNGEARLREAAKLGFKEAIVPISNQPKKAIGGLQTTGVRHISAALAAVNS